MTNNITSVEKSFINQISSDNMPFAYSSSEAFVSYLKGQCKLSKSNLENSKPAMYYAFCKFKLNLIQLHKALLELEIESTCALIRNYPDKDFKNILDYRLINIMRDFKMAFEAISKTRIDEYKSAFMRDILTNTFCTTSSFDPDYFDTFSKTFSENISNYSKMYNVSYLDDKIMIVSEFLNILEDLKKILVYIYKTYDVNSLNKFSIYK